MLSQPPRWRASCPRCPEAAKRRHLDILGECSTRAQLALPDHAAYCWDPDKIPQFGLIAEHVGKVNPDLVVRDEDGKFSTVRYEAVNAMLLNEFLKEHRSVQELKATGAQQQAEFELIRHAAEADRSSHRRIAKGRDSP